MGSSIFKRVSKGEIKGWVMGEVLDSLPVDFFSDPISSIREMGGEVVKESTWRWAAIFRLPNGMRVFLKRDEAKGWPEYVKYLLLPSKGQKEFLIASQLERKKLKIPKPLGWMERIRRGLVRESYYLSKATGTGVSFIDEVAKAKEPRSIIELAMTVRAFQDAGLFHQDLHGGNFLWEGGSLFLTDSHRAKIMETLSLSQRLWNLAHLFHSLRKMWGETEQLQFLDRYFDGMSGGHEKREILFDRIYPSMDRLLRRQWRSRTKRCLKESGEFMVQKERGLRYFHRRDFSLDRLKRMLDEHRALVRERPSCLVKNSPEVNVSVLKDEGERISLKQFYYPHFWGRMKEYLRRSKGLKAWVAANGLRARGIPTLRPLALVERKDWMGLKESFLFMEAPASDLEMDRYVLKGFEDLKRKRFFVKGFARWLGGLHRMSVYHKDMKTCNILVSEKGEAWDFHFLDFEDIRLDEKVNGKKLFRNFLQLNTSTPRLMTKVDRFRFFREYLCFNPVVKDEKAFLRGLMDESRRRGLVYVSPQGVVTERLT
ncbi:MAG TPA: lipopolysaccharide kinase InaA family protein [Thermodesulfobacteriota bacterium]|nr:lipopolysaccharide kinase InaA family protein [Thermodesulfobacteriota bacterium]